MTRLWPNLFRLRLRMVGTVTTINCRCPVWPVLVAFDGTFPVWFNDDELNAVEVQP